MNLNHRFCSICTVLLVTLLMALGCGTAKHIPTTTTNVVTVVKDSLVIRKDTVTIEIPVEVHTNVAEQNSYLETSVATSTASVDSLGLLHHQLQNKQTSLKKEIQYVDRYVETVRDSLVRVEVPVEVEVIKKVVPRWCWSLLVFNILIGAAAAALAYFKFKNKFKL